MENGIKRTKLFLHLKKWLERAALDYGMIAAGDKVLVGVSGGVDSMALLSLLNTPMLYLPPFAVMAVHIDLGFDPQDIGAGVLARWLQEGGHDFVIDRTDIGPLSHSDYNRKNPCFLCSRLRRKRIFEIAEQHGCNKIAFAHHRDDIIETLLINIFYGREISTMVPDQSIFGGKLHIIRPLAYMEEALVKKFAAEQGFPVIEELCPTSSVSRRRYIKDLLKKLAEENPDIKENIWKSMGHVKTDYIPAKLGGK
ncbi:MAG: tRNA 2-thiocytidine(32) synthetase TtcA [Syntrophobacterales bacterium]|nr:tRNA 2-thiocytidine(32) synthetase TtcA [Syntrophobacterales bacterium]